MPTQPCLLHAGAVAAPGQSPQLPWAWGSWSSKCSLLLASFCPSLLFASSLAVECPCLWPWRQPCCPWGERRVWRVCGTGWAPADLRDICWRPRPGCVITKHGAPLHRELQDVFSSEASQKLHALQPGGGGSGRAQPRVAGAALWGLPRALCLPRGC